MFLLYKRCIYTDSINKIHLSNYSQYYVPILELHRSNVLEKVQMLLCNDKQKKSKNTMRAP